jgi:secreted PhoX family phosphatase
MDRRTFLKGIAAAAASGAVVSPFQALAHPRAGRRRRRRPDYGPLRPTLDRTTGLPLLALPEGFSYLSMSWAGEPLLGGGVVPGLHDGGAVLRGRRGLLHYVRNHERSAGLPFAPSGAVYDPGAGGGTTTVVFDPRRGRHLATFPSLGGTVRNCAGGPTPWNSWLSCEETRAGPPTFRERHGFVFEVPAVRPADPRPLRGLGRFQHEAVAVNPWTGIVYLTEDRQRSGLYRFVPERYGRLREGGRLEMLRVVGAPGFQTGRGMADGSSFRVDWVPIADPEDAPFSQGAAAGAAVFRRGEGIWYGRGQVDFCCTTGGAAGAGQVWRLDPWRDRLTLLFESPGRAVLNQPDNIAIGPRGGAVLCEDGPGAPMYVRGLSREGELFDLVRNDVVLDEAANPSVPPGDYRGSEFAGASFAPGGRWLFVSTQRPGITFAITGPWWRGPL